MSASGRAAVLRRFQWVDGHADIWRVFADGDALGQVVAALADPWRDQGITHVAGVESRGFLLGGAAAVALKVGFVAIRKDGTSLLPGPTVRQIAQADYRGVRHELRMQAVLTPGDRVLLVDDWAERGSQARAATSLIQACGATFAGMSIVVDMLLPQVRQELGRVTAVIHADELGPAI